jgi:hypothetical protein
MDGAARNLWIASIALGGLVLAVSARADWADDFDGGFAEIWTFEAVDDIGDPPATGVSAFEIVEAGADDYLRISHSTTAFRDGGGGATDGFGFVSEIFGDMEVSADLNAQPSDGQQNILAVIGRGNSLAGTAYVAGVDFANSFFAIARSDNLFDFLVPLVSDTSVAIDPNEAYRVQFFLLGSSLTAQLTEVSSGDILSTIAAVDSFYASGIAGVLVETEYDFDDFPVAPIIGTFDNVQAVPEPSIVNLIGWGVGALLLFQRRRLG